MIGPRSSTDEPVGRDLVIDSAPVEADLAALLNSEVSVIETGQEGGAASTRGQSGSDTGKKRKAESQEPLAGTQRPLPSTQRVGAVFIENGSTEQATRSGGAEGMTGALSITRRVPEGPGGPVDIAPIQYIPRTDDEKQAIVSRLSVEWLRSLHGQIDDLYKQVVTEFNSPPESAERALGMLREARQILIERPEEFVNAEYRTLQVRATLDRMRTSRRASGYYGPRVLGYEISWMLLFLVGLVFATPLANWIATLGSLLATSAAVGVLPFWNTMMWGGVGGAVGALYHLWWHVSDRQDFDRQYLMWYLVQPVMGLVLGGIMFLLVTGGLLALEVDLTSTTASTAARVLPYLLAVLGGFRQNFVYEQFDRVIALFTPGGQRGLNNKDNGKGA
jgi:hypothetical protein